MILLSFLYIWLAEPMAFQREASARDLIRQLGQDYVQAQHQHFTETPRCRLAVEEGRSDFPGMGGFHFVAVICDVDTPCGESFMRMVWHEPLLGAYITADPFSTDIGIACPEMLNDEARKRFEEAWQ